MTAIVAFGRARNLSITALNGESVVVQREVVGGQVPDQPDVGVCDEELRIGRVNDEHTQRLIVGDLLSQAVDLADERHVEQVDRWIVDRRAADRIVDRDAQKPVVVVSHEQTV